MIIIGEKINATRKSIAKAILSRDEDEIKRQIEAQDAAGASYIDLNAGTGSGDEDKEVEDMKWLLDLALKTTEKNVCIDSANPLIIRKAVEHLDDRRPFLVNSIKYDEKIFDVLFPIITQKKMPFIALAMDEEGIPKDAEARAEVCLKIYEAAKKAGIVEENIFFDTLVMPVSADWGYGCIALDALEIVKKAVPAAKTSMGVSNISFGLKKRFWVNEAFIIAALSRGLDAAICDPTKESTRRAILLGELIAGKDKYCRRYSRALRQGVFDKK
ncbi:MAG: dihydropteroate synthase [Candidatus Aminicenantes bacterium]|nr:dihydropteroate synthase [Candidatus Aminicenantes bacterium]